MSAEPPRTLGARLRAKLPELVLEAASVVFAVLLALGVDEWREARARRELAERALAAVANEIRVNAAELRETEQAHSALRERVADALKAPEDSRVDLAVDYGIPLLTASAWHTAQATQALQEVDFDRLVRLAQLYELQELFGGAQTGVLEQLNRMGEIEQRGMKPVIGELHQRLSAAGNFEAALLREYDAWIAGQPSTLRDQAAAPTH